MIISEIDRDEIVLKDLKWYGQPCLFLLLKTVLFRKCACGCTSNHSNYFLA